MARAVALGKHGYRRIRLWSGGLDQLSPAYHLATRDNGRAGIPSWLTDAPLEDLRTAWFAAPDVTAQRVLAEKIQARALEVGAYIPCGQYFQPTAYRRDLEGVLTGLPLFWNVRRAA